MKIVALLLAAVFLVGCALSPVREARTITLTVEQARSAHATATTLYRALYERLAPLCVGGVAASELPMPLGQPLAPDCPKLGQIHREFQRLDFELRRALDNPGVEIDWARVEDLLRLVADLAIP